MIKKLALTAAVLSSLAMSTGANALALPAITPATQDLASYWASISSNWQTYADQTISGSWTSTATQNFGPAYSKTTSYYTWTLSITSTLTAKLASGLETFDKTVSTLYGPGAVVLGPSTTTNVGKSNYAVAASVAVPGPVAGAGLPLLLALGGAAFVFRRKGAVAA